MTRMVEMHVPVYEKKGPVYRLARFMRVGADVESTRQLLPALGALSRAPCVVFMAGEARHFMCFEDLKQADAKTGINMSWGYEVLEVDERKHDGEEDLQTRMMPTSTAMVFFDKKGSLTCLPIRDYMAEYPQVVPASQMLRYMEHLTRRQAELLLRLVGQVSFVNVVAEQVSSTERVALPANGVAHLIRAQLRLREARFGWESAMEA